MVSNDSVIFPGVAGSMTIETRNFSFPHHPEGTEFKYQSVSELFSQWLE